jgi:uncharacterized phiE125 gp8 family phage protein
MIIYSNATLPTELVVSLTEVKAWLKIDGTDEDTLLTSLIASATAECEAYAGLSFITRTRTVSLTHFHGKDILLPYGPVTELTSIEYVDQDDADQTIDDADYSIDMASGLARVRVTETWPSTNRTLSNVVVTYVAGYEDAAAVPEIIKTAIKKKVALDYEKRGDTNEDSEAWMRTLDRIKVYWNAEYCY